MTTTPPPKPPCVYCADGYKREGRARVSAIWACERHVWMLWTAEATRKGLRRPL